MSGVVVTADRSMHLQFSTSYWTRPWRSWSPTMMSVYSDWERAGPGPHPAGRAERQYREDPRGLADVEIMLV
jgi:hypothetical protein